jgi:pSer/pThr/pTyr-binding forkhead associated (FHA) protein
VPLVDGDNTIGRDAHSRLQLDDSTVSRRHARITLNGANAWLEDLGSKNGTCVGGVRIVGRVGLHDGDRLAFGRIVVTFHEASTASPTATQMSRFGGLGSSVRS